MHFSDQSSSNSGHLGVLWYWRHPHRNGSCRSKSRNSLGLNASPWYQYLALSSAIRHGTSWFRKIMWVLFRRVSFLALSVYSVTHSNCSWPTPFSVYSMDGSARTRSVERGRLKNGQVSSRGGHLSKRLVQEETSTGPRSDRAGGVPRPQRPCGPTLPGRQHLGKLFAAQGTAIRNGELRCALLHEN